jgi:hypothetical protein
MKGNEFLGWFMPSFSERPSKKLFLTLLGPRLLNATVGQLLRGQIEGIYQKGSLPPRDFVEQGVEVIERKTMTNGDV